MTEAIFILFMITGMIVWAFIIYAILKIWMGK